MTQDKSKKTTREFRCRDYLWDFFEQLSDELECSVDYLINEAMRHYLKSRQAGQQRGGSPSLSGSWSEARTGSRSALGGASSIAPSFTDDSLAQSSVSTTHPPAGRPQVPNRRGTSPLANTLTEPPTQRGNAASAKHSMGAPPPKVPTGSGSGIALPGLSSSRKPSTRPIGAQGAGMAVPRTDQNPTRPPLFVLFQGRKLPVDKEEFLIGRGARSADLSIKDGNISRRHAVILFQEGAYYLKDLGSTNGVEFAGRRIDAKRIDEGDVFFLCDYELRFTYR